MRVCNSCMKVDGATHDLQLHTMLYTLILPRLHSLAANQASLGWFRFNGSRLYALQSSTDKTICQATVSTVSLRPQWRSNALTGYVGHRHSVLSLTKTYSKGILGPLFRKVVRINSQFKSVLNQLVSKLAKA